MKKLHLYKTIQLIIMIVLSFVTLYMVFTDPEISQAVAVNATLIILCVLIWIILLVSFSFLLIDFYVFTKVKYDYTKFDNEIYSDHLSGIANRYSCDLFVHKYAAQDLPEDFACIVLSLSDIDTINSKYGRSYGDDCIYEFSQILISGVGNLSFVGRNSGNQFFAFGEHSSKEDVDLFFANVDAQINKRNPNISTCPLHYSSGVVLNSLEKEPIKNIYEMIRLANKRLKD